VSAWFAKHRDALGLQLSGAVLNVVALRALTEELSPDAFGRLSMLLLASSLLTGISVLPMMQVALRDGLLRERPHRQRVLTGPVRALDRVLLGVLAASALFVTLGLPTYRLEVLALLLIVIGNRAWSVAKTELNLVEQDRVYLIITALQQFLAAALTAVLVATVMPPEPMIPVLFGTLLLATGAGAQAWVGRRWRLADQGTSVVAVAESPRSSRAVLRDIVALAPSTASAWLSLAVPRLYLAITGSVPVFAYLAAVWSPLNQGFQMVSSATILVERPRAFARAGRGEPMWQWLRPWLLATLAVGATVAMLAVATSPIWQSLALARPYRAEIIVVVALVLGNLAWLMSQVLEQALFALNRQHLNWVSAASASAIVLALGVGFVPTATVFSAAMIGLATFVSHALILAALAGHSLRDGRTDRRVDA
jgi:hypothetical protein